jgi:hypothetical protein
LKEKYVLKKKIKILTISLNEIVIFVDNFNDNQILFQLLSKLRDLVFDQQYLS